METIRSPRLVVAGAIIAVAFVLAACQDADPTSPPEPRLSRSGATGAAHVSVMTRNVYIGFDGDAAVAALATGDPAVFVPVLQEAVATLRSTDFPTRARTLVEEIARARPAVVGLQEVYAIHADLTPLGVPVQIDLDYLQILQAALAARGLPYVVVATVVDTDMQPFPGIELVDREVMLVDASRVQVGTGVIATTFQYNIGVIASGIDKKAGYIAAPLTIDGAPITVVTTHLESDLGPGTHPFVAQLRAAQAQEIAAVLGTTPQAIVVGDMNDVPGSLMYQVFTAGAGLTDAWPALSHDGPGLTGGCFGPTLSEAQPHCDARIDFILVRGLGHPREGLLGRSSVVGLSQWERVPGPAGLIWPSDHAGVLADVVVPPAHGLRQ